MDAADAEPSRTTTSRLLTWAASALLLATWTSTALFGAYILAFYGGAAADDALWRWNLNLPDLHSTDHPQATAGIGLHFLGGGLLLILGPVQLLAPVRRRWPGLHRAVGRVFVVAAGLTALGGLVFIALQGTIGRGVMNVGFGLYGALTLLASVQTARHARARRLDLHEAWGVRLFALMIGSWLYRIEYGVWFMACGGVGHTATFDGPFDWFMAFAFYLPNLALAELYLRARDRERGPALQVAAIVGLGAASAFVLVGTFFFTKHYWGPEILARFG